MKFNNNFRIRLRPLHSIAIAFSLNIIIGKSKTRCHLLNTFVGIIFLFSTFL